MGQSNLIVDARALHNVAKSYVNVINNITNLLYQPTSSQMRPSWPNTVSNKYF